MAELSPAAKAVLDAACSAYDDAATVAQGTAAALYVAAYQLAQIPIVIDDPLRENIAKDTAVIYVADILAIATELENHQ